MPPYCQARWQAHLPRCDWTSACCCAGGRSTTHGARRPARPAKGPSPRDSSGGWPNWSVAAASWRRSTRSWQRHDRARRCGATRADHRRPRRPPRGLAPAALRALRHQSGVVRPPPARGYGGLRGGDTPARRHRARGPGVPGVRLPPRYHGPPARRLGRQPPADPARDAPGILAVSAQTALRGDHRRAPRLPRLPQSPPQGRGGPARPDLGRGPHASPPADNLRLSRVSARCPRATLCRLAPLEDDRHAPDARRARPGAPRPSASSRTDPSFRPGHAIRQRRLCRVFGKRRRAQQHGGGRQSLRERNGG